MYDVITVGSALSDIFVDTGLKAMRKGERKLIAYPVGFKIAVKNIKFSIGGGGTNTAVGFSRMGLKTAFLGKIGNDESANEILKLLKKEKIDFIGKQEKSVSGHSIILDSFEHNRTILTYKGPSDNLKMSDVKLNKLKTKWIYLASSMKQTLETQKKLAIYARKNKIKVAFNPSEYEVKLGIEKLKPILTKTNLLIFNRDEAEILTKQKTIPKIFKKLNSLGITTICITNREHEIYTYHEGKTYKIIPKKVKPVEMTGAGDSFACGFLSGLIKENDINFAMKVGLVNSQSVIRHYGAKNKLLTWREVLKKVKKPKK
jgi:ribokinase